MAKDLHSLDVKYADFDDLRSELVRIGSEVSEKMIEAADLQRTVLNGSNDNLEHILSRQLYDTVWTPITEAGKTLYSTGWMLERQLTTNLTVAGGVCCDTELAVMRALSDQVPIEGGLAAAACVTTSFADEFYTGVIADREEAQRQQEEEDRLKAEQEKKDAEAAAAAAAAFATIAELLPDLAAELEQEMNDARIEALIAYYEDPERGNDPAMAERIRKAYEAMKKAREEAAKAAEEAKGAVDGLLDGSLDVGDSGLGDLGVGGSDWGGSDWGGSGLGGSDWASDLLDENLDTGELWDAASELGDITEAGAVDAVASGMDAVEGDVPDEAAGGLWAQYGPQLAQMAQRYGVQAGLVAGGAIALYATREQTTEAVAHVAEFVTTKCRPAVDDVMEQVRGAAKQTHVRLGHITSGVTAAARGERSGDLIG